MLNFIPLSLKRVSLDVPKPADWDDDSIYNSLDIDSLVAQSQIKVNTPTNGGDQTVLEHVGTQRPDPFDLVQKVNVILSGSPELFGSDCSRISDHVIDNGSGDGNGKGLQDRRTSRQEKHSALLPVASSTQYDKQADLDLVHQHKLMKEEDCHRSRQFNPDKNCTKSETWFQSIDALTTHTQEASQSEKNQPDEEIADNITNRSPICKRRNLIQNEDSGANSINQVESQKSETSKDFNLSLGSRLKQKLHKNARESTPIGQRSSSAYRRVRVDDALKEMINLDTDDTGDKDIGPFYGLPSKVQELLTLHRGITTLYGKLL